MSRARDTEYGDFVICRLVGREEAGGGMTFFLFCDYDCVCVWESRMCVGCRGKGEPGTGG